MKYFKNTELAKIYNVSEKSVRNWIEATEAGKLELELFTLTGRHYIANTSKNLTLIEGLVAKGKKFKNTRGARKLFPQDDFYNLYNQKQILDIVSSLNIYRESPLQYTYVDGGAEDWDRYSRKLSEEQSTNLQNQTIELIEDTAQSVDKLLANYERINVIDLGPGNGMPIRKTLERLLKEGRLNKYVPVDISQDMLSILERNVHEWFGDAVKVETCVRDITYQRFNDILVNNFTDSKTANLVFFLGGTLSNFRAPEQILQSINGSLGPNDILIHNSYLDTPKNRRFFDYTSNRKVPIQDGLILDLLNVDESLYDVEQVFNEEKRARSLSIRPKVDLTITFELSDDTYSIELPKGEPILIWRHWHETMVEIVNKFDRNGFDVMQAAKSPDGNYALIISKIQVGVRPRR